MPERTQRVAVDYAKSDSNHVVSGVPQGSVLSTLLFVLYTNDTFDLFENKLFAYAVEPTLVAVVPKVSDRAAVCASLNRDLPKIYQ